MNEQPPVTPATPEGNREKMHSKTEVLTALLSFVNEVSAAEDLEGSIARELGNDDGLYLLEVIRPGEKPGETEEYRYMRAGDHGKQNTSEKSRLDVVYYDADGVPQGGKPLATFNEQTGAWEAVPASPLTANT